VTALAASRGVELSAVERYGLVDDAWASLLAGSIGTPEFLALLRSFAEESDLSVWQRIIGCLGALDRIVPEDDRDDLRAFVRALLGPALHKLGDRRADEPGRTSALRAALFEGLGTTGADEEVGARARTVLESGWDAPPADADLFDASVRIVAEVGGEATFDEYLALADKAATAQDELRYLGALDAVPEPEAEPEPEAPAETLFDTGRSPPGAPKVALSFLQWSNDPARRFAFISIDGAPTQRVHEGEVAAGLTVAAITPTGVQFKREGTTFVIRPRH
jgi:hypothetical protein